MDIAGQDVLDRETYEEVKEDVRRMSDGTLERLEEASLL